MSTPVRQQYLEIKKKYPETIVFFRLGDFYETFEEDAKIVSKELEIVLTSRGVGNGNRVPLAGIPHHALEGYLAKLINKGHKVAICEQVGEPECGKGLVKREVVRVVTPGTVVEPNILELKFNNYLLALVVEGEKAGIAYADITTSEFATAQLSVAKVPSELSRLNPSEIIIPETRGCNPLVISNFVNSAQITLLDDIWFELETARQLLLDHFEVASLEGYGCAHLPLALKAAGAIVHYLQETQKESLGQLTGLSTYSTENFMVIDTQTRQNLEIFESSRLRTSGGSLLSILDLTKTPMGGRLLKKWLGQPLLSLRELTQRQDAVEWFVSNTAERLQARELLNKISDLERLINRTRRGIVTPKELVSLRHSLEIVPQIKSLFEKENPLKWLSSELKPCDEVVSLISLAIAEEPSQTLGEGEVVKKGFSEELDRICLASRDAKKYLANLEQKERKRTGIKSLKVGYNKVFGYYIEVTTANLENVPENYIRKQTLSNGERFFTPELKEYESLILNAQERISELENSLFKQVCSQVGNWGEQILSTASALAQIDVLSAFAEVAVRQSYVRPILAEGNEIKIRGGRHPVVEKRLSNSFIPNDTYLSNEDAQLIVLTGPNMSGKSTYLRQVALIVLLAQIGSFVPAESVEIGLVDRIFTRIGLMDDLATGRSTFMIEMEETANILNNATPKSLIILDEIGRGTSTYDGLSIAKAVAEHIHNSPQLGSKTLFATHYHELTELANYLPRAKNFNVAVTEEGGKVVLLHKIVPGGADKSYGIHVAQIAGLPKSVIQRAQEVLSELESPVSQRKVRQTRKAHNPRRASSSGQFSLFNA